MASETTLPLTVIRVEGAERHALDDVLAVEEPLEIRLGTTDAAQRTYRSISVTMRTPGNDRELAAGFLFTEGIIALGGQIESIEPWGPLSSEALSRNIVKVDLVPGVAVDLKRLERHFYTSSSCGVCGKASLDAVRVAACLKRLTSTIRVDGAVLHSLPARLREAQDTFSLTGGLHAAALFTAQGDLIALREDVGRHNALDKLIGWHLLENRPMTDTVLLVSGRASFELVQKAVAAGIPVFAAVGAPSSLAFQLADEFGLTLAGFVRNQRFNIYCGEGRISASTLS